MASARLYKNKNAAYVKSGVEKELRAYKFNIIDFLYVEEGIDPEAYFKTTGCAVQKLKYMVTVYKEAKSPQLSEVKKLAKLLKRLMGRYCWLETEPWDGQLYLMPKNPRGLPQNYAGLIKAKNAKPKQKFINWDKRLTQLINYIEAHNKLPSTYITKYQKEYGLTRVERSSHILATWLVRQRMAQKRGNLEQHRYDKLNALPNMRWFKAK